MARLVDPDGVAAVLARTHALILPSTWEEPFPLVTIEGAFARVPLVASDVGGVGEGCTTRSTRCCTRRAIPRRRPAALARTLRDTDETAAR